MTPTLVRLALCASGFVHASDGFRLHPATFNTSLSLPSGASSYRASFDLAKDDASAVVAQRAKPVSEWLNSTKTSATLSFEVDAGGRSGAFWSGRRLDETRGGDASNGWWESAVETPVPSRLVLADNTYTIPTQALATNSYKLTTSWSTCNGDVLLEWSYLSALSDELLNQVSIRGTMRIRIPASSSNRTWTWNLPRAVSEGGITAKEGMDFRAKCGDGPFERPLAGAMRRMPAASGGVVTLPTQTFSFTGTNPTIPTLDAVLPGSIAFHNPIGTGVPLYQVTTTDGRSGIMHLWRSNGQTVQYFDGLTGAGGKAWDGSQAHFFWKDGNGNPGRSVERFFQPVTTNPVDASGYSAASGTEGAIVKVRAEFLNDDASATDPNGFQYKPSGIRLDYRRVSGAADGGEYGRSWGADGATLQMPIRRAGRMEWGRLAPGQVTFSIQEKRDAWSSQTSVSTEGRLDLNNPPPPDGEISPEHSFEHVSGTGTESSFRIPSGAATFVFSTRKSGKAFTEPEVLVYPIEGIAEGSAPIGSYFRRIGTAVNKATVTAVVVPGTWDFVGRAKQDGRRIVFGKVRRTIKAGDRLLLDFGAPEIDVAGVAVGACIGNQGVQVDAFAHLADDGVATGIKEISWKMEGAATWNTTAIARSFSEQYGYEARTTFQVPAPAGGDGNLLVKSVSLPDEDEGIVQYPIHVDKAVTPIVGLGQWTPPPATNALAFTFAGEVTAGSNPILSVSIQRKVGDVWTDAAPGLLSGSGAFTGTVYMRPGLNTFRYIARDRCGHEGVSTEFEVVSTNKDPSVELSCAQIEKNALVGKNIQFTASASDADGDPLTWAWNVNGSSLPSSGSSASWFVGSSDPFNVQACASDPMHSPICASCRIEPGSRNAAMDCDLDPEGCGDNVHAPIDGPAFKGAMWGTNATNVFGVIRFCPTKGAMELEPFETERFLYLDQDGDPANGAAGFETRWTIMYLRKADARSPAPIEIRRDAWSFNGWVPMSNEALAASPIAYASNKTLAQEPWMDGTAGAWELLEFKLARPTSTVKSIRWYVDAPGYGESRGPGNPYKFTFPDEESKIDVDGRTCDWMNTSCAPVNPILGFNDPALWTKNGFGVTEQKVGTITGDPSTKTEGAQSIKVTRTSDGDAIIESRITLTNEMVCATSASIDIKLPTSAINWGTIQLRIRDRNNNYSPISSSAMSIDPSQYDGTWKTFTFALPNGIRFNSDVSVSVGTEVGLQVVVNGEGGTSFNLDNLRFEGTGGCDADVPPIVTPPTGGVVLGFESTIGLTLSGCGTGFGTSTTHTEGANSLSLPVCDGERVIEGKSIVLPETINSSMSLKIDVWLPQKDVNAWAGSIALRDFSTVSATTTTQINYYQQFLFSSDDYKQAWKTLTFPLPSGWASGTKQNFKIVFNGATIGPLVDNFRIE